MFKLSRDTRTLCRVVAATGIQSLLLANSRRTVTNSTQRLIHTITDCLYRDYVIRNTVGVEGDAIVFDDKHRRIGNAMAIKDFRVTMTNSSIL